jgi:hypothetical protein
MTRTHQDKLDDVLDAFNVDISILIAVLLQKLVDRFGKFANFRFLKFCRRVSRFLNGLEDPLLIVRGPISIPFGDERCWHT